MPRLTGKHIGPTIWQSVYNNEHIPAYYVDATNGSDSNSGLSSTDAWQTIAKVNGETFNPGESVLFKRGETWRETLTMPSSGIADASIIFGAYSSGADPIINGADVISTWTEHSVSGFTDALATGDIDLFVQNHRLAFLAADLSGAGPRIRVTFKANAAGVNDTVITDCAIQEQAADEDYTGVPVAITFDGGAANKTITPGNSATSDWITFAYDGANSYLVHVFSNVLQSGSYGASAAPRHWYREDFADDTQNKTETVDWTSDSQSDSRFLVSEIQYLGAWQAALVTEPYQVFMDAIRLTKGADQNSLNDHEWFWVGNVLYVRDDTGDPDGTGVVIEASVRSYCIDIPNTTDFITLDNIHAANSNAVNIRMKGNGFIIRDSLSDYAYSDCIAVSAPSTDVSLGLINNCEAAYSSTESGIYVGGVDPGPSNVIVEYCEVHHNGIVNGDNGIYFSAVHNCTARYNSLHDNAGNGIQFQLGSDDNECYYNLIYDNGFDGIWIGSGAAGEDNNIYNNVVFNNAETGINVGVNAAGNVIENNIVFQDSAVVGAWKPCIQFANATVRQAQTWNYNCAFYDGQAANTYHDSNLDDYYTLAQFQVLTGSPGANSISSDPVFVNEGIPDFHLQIGSLCRNVGEDVGLSPDYDGVSVPQEANPAIGAYEYIP